MNITPLHTQVFIRPDKEEEITKSGIILPENNEKRPYTGTVIHKSASVTDVKLGDHVLFKKFSTEDVEIGENKFSVVDINDILAII